MMLHFMHCLFALPILCMSVDNCAANSKFYEMPDGSLINAATYNMDKIQYLSPDSPPIVLLHGFMNSRRYWDSLLSIMLNNTLFSNNPIITISLRGMGDSQYINLETPNNYMTNINDIFTVLSQIGINENVKCIFIGQSFGSMVTNKLVINKPNRVFGIVLMGTLSYTDDIIDNIIDSFTWHNGNNWTQSLINYANTNWNVPYNDGRIDKEYLYLMKSEQMKFKYEIMTQTQFRPYDLREEIQNKQYFNNIPIVIVRGNMDFIPLETVKPLIEIGDNVVLLDYECDSCDHDIVFGHEQHICDKLYEIMQHTKLTKVEL
eukprot:174908_1